MKNVITLSTLTSSALISLNSLAAEPPKDNKLQSPQGLYVTATEAHKMMQKDKNIILIDVRTPEEWQFVGHAPVTKMYIPSFTFDYSQMDKNGKRYQAVRNNNFMDDFENQAAELDVDEDNSYILMCRSGLQGASRSLPAAKLMHQYGYENVYIMVDGFEGKKSEKGAKKGFRLVNGWKNSNLPWVYKIDSQKTYFINK